MIRAGLAVGTMLALAGCTAMSLHRYVGHDLDEFVARYGPPAERRLLPNGEQRMQWVFGRQRAVNAPLDAFRPLDEAPLKRRRLAQANGSLFGGSCVYTLRVRQDPATQRWRIVAYQKPSLPCS